VDRYAVKFKKPYYFIINMSDSSESKPEHKPSKVAELLLKLQEDSKILKEFNKDADKIMIESGITSEEVRNILKSRDILKVRQLLAKEM
jgi:hypothetical protein